MNTFQHPTDPNGTVPPSAGGSTPHRALVVIGLALLGGCIALPAMSPQLTDFQAAGVAGTIGLIALLMFMGAIFLLLLRRVPDCRASPRLLIFCMAVGLVMRLTQWGTAPAYEDDYVRYLWDGAVTSAGLDPYAAPPADVEPQRLLRSLRDGTVDREDRRVWALADLADASPGLVERASYAYVTTIYPPLAQLAFAAAHRIENFSLDAWRAVLTCCELLGLLALLRLLTDTGESPLWSLLYWWNPVAVAQIAHAAHMDALLVPFILVALWAMTRQRPFFAATVLAGAAAIKLWPLLLIPSLMSASPERRKNLLAVTLGLALSSLLLWPQLRHLGSGDAGLQAFASEWVRNGFAFRWLTQALAVTTSVGVGADPIARLCVLLIVGGLCLYTGFAGPTGVRVWARRWAICIAALFLLAPTGYPWYFVWFLPLLCFWRAVPLLMLTALLPMYYGWFAVDALGRDPLMQEMLLAAQFLPVWIGLAWMAWRHHPPQPALAHA